MNKNIQKLKRKKRVRTNISGTKERPRLTVFRSNQFIYAQLIDDQVGKTLVGMSEKQLEDNAGNKIERAKKLGIALAKKALEKKIVIVVFDRGGYKYHGRVKSFADGMREGGVKF